MRITLGCLLIVGVASVSYAAAQYGGFGNYLPYGFSDFRGYPNYPVAPGQHSYSGNANNYPNENLFRDHSEQPLPSKIEYSGSPFARGGTLTITIATTTYTSTITTSTTCTTTTAAISVCSPSLGRRRRLAGPLEKSALFSHNEDNDEDEGIFLIKPRENVPETPSISSSVIEQKKEGEVVVPFVVQPGFKTPNGEFGRFLIAFGTSTFTTTKTSTYIYSLTATCASTTSYQYCGSG